MVVSLLKKKRGHQEEFESSTSYQNGGKYFIVET